MSFDAGPGSGTIWWRLRPGHEPSSAYPRPAHSSHTPPRPASRYVTRRHALSAVAYTPCASGMTPSAVSCCAAAPLGAPPPTSTSAAEPASLSVTAIENAAARAT